MSSKTVTLAEPVPPAGGEVEVVAWRSSDAFGAVYAYEPDRPADEYHGLVTLEAHRAHVARLQAEVERLNETCTGLDRQNDALAAEIETLQSEVAVLRQEVETRIGAEVNAIEHLQRTQSELTKARELLGHFANYAEGSASSTVGLWVKEARKLTAHQSAPAAKADDEPV